MGALDLAERRSFAPSAFPSHPDEDLTMRLACLTACAVIAAGAFLPARAADSPDKPTYQERFATCAHESKGLRGEEHQRFMGDCLKDGTAAARTHEARNGGSQQNRMRTCNAEAHEKDLHGEERRAFMSACLRG